MLFLATRRRANYGLPSFGIVCLLVSFLLVSTLPRAQAQTQAQSAQAQSAQAQSAQAQSAQAQSEPRLGGGKIVGGFKARLAHWPGIAVLRQYDAAADMALYFCGGTAIAPRWILTAAHCLHDYTQGTKSAFNDAAGVTHPSELQVVLGVSDLKRSQTGNLYGVDRVIIHPDYLARIKQARALPDPNAVQDALGQIALYFGQDIALLHLTRDWHGAVSQLSLTGQDDPAPDARRRVAVAGFGKTIGDWSVAGLKRYSHSARRKGVLLAGSDILLQTAIEAVPRKACKAVHGANAVIGSGQICAGLEQGGKDSCNGDSGGPLNAFDGRGTPYQIGLVSWGKLSCASGKAYGVYTRLSQFAPWVQSHTGPLNSSIVPVSGSSAARLNTTQIALALAQLESLLGSRRGKLHLAIEGGVRVRLGRKLRFSARSTTAGKLVILDINAIGQVTLIFPNNVFAGQVTTLIRAGQQIDVPDRGHGNAFQASEPVGKGRLLALVVPPAFDIERFAASARIVGKDFAPVREPASYFMRLIRQIETFLSSAHANNNGGDGAEGWAYTVLDYEIYR